MVSEPSIKKVLFEMQEHNTLLCVGISYEQDYKNILECFG